MLPFTAPSGKPDDIVFGAGLSAIVATRLAAGHAGIWIVPEADLRRNRVITPDDARRAFGAPLALTGTIERPDGRAKVTMHLVDTGSGKILRSGLAVSAIAGGTLQTEVMKQALLLLNSRADTGTTPDTRTPTAYDHYVLASGYLQRYDQAGNLDAAVHEFQQAIQLDPACSLAYAGLSSAWWRQYRSAADPQLLERARDAAMRALSRNLGGVQMARGEWNDAEQSFRRAIAPLVRSIRIWVHSIFFWGVTMKPCRCWNKPLS